MVLCRLSFLILFIAIGINETVSKIESVHNTTTSAPKNLLQKEDNSTRKEMSLPIEGGGNIVVTPRNPSLLKENDGILLSKMPSEEFGDTSTKTRGHVVGRTGAPVIPYVKEISTKSPVVIQKSTIVTKLTNTTTAVPPPSSTKAPHKPTVLKYEEESSIVADKTSHPGISDGASKIETNKAGSHPGMIMPIVIAILVVPLLAVLGYMTIKRGQEAWKNRHYKRMDFLLDGMYND
ncbi:uncharacterized protein LOC134741451 [Cydia strobilella]|uniref:uncharacterized protein LOC134741451 n=1 Tax=Cydia strobilella TaxID=1100964 RepID=UPI0030069083